MTKKAVYYSRNEKTIAFACGRHYGGDRTMILEQVKEIIANQMGVSADEINAGTSLKDDLQADSLDVVELVMAAEEKFGVEIDEEAVISMVTVGDVVSYIEKKQN